MKPWDAIRIGDHVAPAGNPLHPTMIVYDVEEDLDVAYCSWLVGHRMRRAAHLVQRLVRVPRMAHRSVAGRHR